MIREFAMTCAVLAALELPAQQKASTVVQGGTCNVVTTAANSLVNVQCLGMEKAEGRRIQAILNKLLRDRTLLASNLDAIERTLENSTMKRKGLLTPADDPTSPGPCKSFSLTKDTIIVKAGGETMITESFPFNAITLREGPVLTIYKENDGLAISATIRGKDGRIVATIDRNEFIGNLNNILDLESPDTHTLRVVDEFGNEALYVHFDNPNQVSFRGIFFHANGHLRDDVTDSGITRRSDNMPWPSYFPIMNVCSAFNLHGLSLD